MSDREFALIIFLYFSIGFSFRTDLDGKKLPPFVAGFFILVWPIIFAIILWDKVTEYLGRFIRWGCNDD